MTLVILAAGMGSRFGGLKQITPVTDDGRFIIDFSVYDAVLSGFDRIVFVIKKENFDDFRTTVGKRFEHITKVEYAFQDISDLPSGFSVPVGRVRPWGTAHALLCAANKVDDPFAVINADDFYGREAFCMLASHLKSLSADGGSDKKAHYCMVGYELEKTLTENGTVSRGVCRITPDGMLDDVVERTKIYGRDGRIYFEEDGSEYELPAGTVVSMNCWGFMPDFFGYLARGFERFLKGAADPHKSEYYLPFAAREMMAEGLCDVRVYRTHDMWYGVTYREDSAHVRDGIQSLINKGVYPADAN